MAICILVLEHEKTVYEFWEKLNSSSTTISNFQVIEPKTDKTDSLRTTEVRVSKDHPPKVKINELEMFNPDLSRKDRQKKMSLWLMPFGFIAGLTFAGMTNLETFSAFGFSRATQTFLGGLLGMVSGWIGSFFGARSVNTSQEDLKALFKRNEQGFWLILMETPFEIELPWQLIKEIDPIETINLSLI
ncbi:MULTISPECIES: hypothetical protein [unclassified Prochlorococcus]|uniref:hypothetical protein n=1 Tax=unclassified Prochlorococcus TaxID=2627481 RepID=UPI000533A5D4|nr:MULTISPECIES: hypothetical protein [unclassified Prochlorococcus]KGG16199.1 hypothetical protein EV07_1366 [Prochlorococcus sp. MIT 0603]KGG18066.1 hypothetical protein EV06_0194 [Prochlorococcus sp. MIT 0602]